MNKIYSIKNKIYSNKNKIYSNKNMIYSNKNKIYRNTHVNIKKSTTVLEDPGTQQRCFRMCGRLKQCVST